MAFKELTQFSRIEYDQWCTEMHPLSTETLDVLIADIDEKLKDAKDQETRRFLLQSRGMCLLFFQDTNPHSHVNIKYDGVKYLKTIRVLQDDVSKMWQLEYMSTLPVAILTMQKADRDMKALWAKESEEKAAKKKIEDEKAAAWKLKNEQDKKAARSKQIVKDTAKAQRVEHIKTLEMKMINASLIWLITSGS